MSSHRKLCHWSQYWTQLILCLSFKGRGFDRDRHGDRDCSSPHERGDGPYNSTNPRVDRMHLLERSIYQSVKKQIGSTKFCCDSVCLQPPVHHLSTSRESPIFKTWLQHKLVSVVYDSWDGDCILNEFLNLSRYSPYQRGQNRISMLWMSSKQCLRPSNQDVWQRQWSFSLLQV